MRVMYFEDYCNQFEDEIADRANDEGISFDDAAQQMYEIWVDNFMLAEV